MASALDTIDPAWAWQPFVPTEKQRWNRRWRRICFAAPRSAPQPRKSTPPSSKVPHPSSNRSCAARRIRSDFRGQSDDLASTLLATGEPRQLAAWWVYVMLHTTHPLLERMTLFWHGHFATSAEKVTDAALMLEQNRLLRRYALGDFRPLVQEISRDPAMLVYLDSATNRKAHPNENYARELMELFCLGEGNYSEKDVQELARCFTGWEIKLGKFRFNRFQHDSSAKTVLGKTGPFEDGESIDWILEQPQAAQFIVGKLYRQFVCDEPAPPPQLLEPLANELREHEWQIGSCRRADPWQSTLLFLARHWTQGAIAGRFGRRLAAIARGDGEHASIGGRLAAEWPGAVFSAQCQRVGRRPRLDQLVDDPGSRQHDCPTDWRRKNAIRRREAGRVFCTAWERTDRNRSSICWSICCSRCRCRRLPATA